MTTADPVGILRTLADRGLQIRLADSGRDLRVGPASRLTPELREEIQTHKAELIKALAHRWMIHEVRSWPAGWRDLWKVGVLRLIQTRGLGREDAGVLIYLEIVGIARLLAEAAAEDPKSTPKSPRQTNGDARSEAGMSLWSWEKSTPHFASHELSTPAGPGGGAGGLR